MAPSVRFYHNTPDRLVLACELIGRAYGSGRKVAVRMPDGNSARELDRVLWLRDTLAFVPHVLRDSELAAETPVVIGEAVPASPGRMPTPCSTSHRTCRRITRTSGS